MKDYYKILGVERTASGEEIKRAYHRLVRKLHPDSNPSGFDVKKFSEINEAYQQIGILENRLKYRQLLVSKDEVMKEEKVKKTKSKKKKKWFK